MSEVAIQCPNCGKRYRIDASLVGKQARCHRCTNTFIVRTTSAFGRPSAHAIAYGELRDEGLRNLAEGNVEKAIEKLGRAICLRPKLAEAHLNIGRAFQQAGRFEAARQAFLLVKKYDENDVHSSQADSALARLPPPPPNREDFRKGEVVSSSTTNTRYMIEDVVGGAFGYVYIATDVASGIRYALKTFQSKYLWVDGIRDRFEREALTWIMLDKHPNIVSVNALVHIQGFPCLELEYVSGGDLATLLDEGPLATDRALEFALNFCDGMNYAHETLGLVHRDVKPANCLIDDEGTLKVTDFGLARSFGRNEPDRLGLAGLDVELPSQYTTPLGTEMYMAPEQGKPGAVLDTRTDVCSFGIMLYEMLTKDQPRAGISFQYITERADMYSIPDGLRRLVLECVQPDRVDRPANFGVLRDSLADIYHRETGKTPQPVARPADVSASDWKNKGVSLGSLGYYEKEIACYDRALEMSRPDSDLWKNRGVALRLLGRNDEAIENYDCGLEIAPSDADLWMNKGVALGELGHYEQEIECYDHALTLAPENHELWKNKGVALGELGRYEEEVRCYERALKSAPRDSELWKNKGVALRLLGRGAEAIACYDRALEITPRDSELWKNKGVALAAQGRYKAAIDCYDLGIEIAPRDAGLWMNKGVALGEQELFEQEIECYDSALVIAPCMSELWLNKSLALRCLGKHEAADICEQKSRPVEDT